MLGEAELLLRSVGSLLLVLAVLLVMVFASRWFMQRRPQGGRRLRFIETMALGSRDKLLLIEIDGQPLLLGVTSHNIRLLTKLDTKKSQPSALAAAPSGLCNKFSVLLARQAQAVKSKEPSKEPSKKQFKESDKEFL